MWSRSSDGAGISREWLERHCEEHIEGGWKGENVESLCLHSELKRIEGECDRHTGEELMSE